MSKLITYAQYFENSARLHNAYYLQIAKKAGIQIPNELVEKSKLALAAGDEHLNSIPLAIWDNISKAYKSRIASANKQINGKSTWCIADGVCAAKALATHMTQK